jgi:hypothetical protein
VALNAWYHIVVTYSAVQDRMVLYVDGVARTTTTGTYGVINASAAANPISIGGIYGSLTQRGSLTGKISDFACWSRALSAPEVAARHDPATRYELLRPQRRLFMPTRPASLWQGLTTTKPVAWDGPPNEPFELNADSPQATNLAGWWPELNNRLCATVRDLAGRNELAATSTQIVQVPDGERGVAWEFPYVNGIWLQVTRPASGELDVGSGSYSFSIWLKLNTSGTSGTNYYAVGGMGNAANYVGWSMQVYPGNHGSYPYRLSFWVTAAHGGPYNEAIANAAITSNAWTHVVGVVDRSAGLCKLYVNGVKQTITASIAAMGTVTGSQNLKLGYLDINSQAWKGHMSEPRIYKRALSDAEVAALYDPATRWEAALPLRLRRPAAYYPVIGYTLTAVYGAFTETGQAGGLRWAARLTAAAGTETLTGQAAGLLAGRKLTAAGGGDTLSGQAAGLRATRLLSAVLGSETLTAPTTYLRRTFPLTSAYGSLSLAGQGAGLLAGRRVAAAAGGLTLTGQTVGLALTRRLAVTAGQVALTGFAAGLRATRTLAGATPTYTLTGFAADLSTGLHLSALAGGWTWTRGDAGMRASRRLLGASGFYTESGQAATLRITGSGDQTLTGTTGVYTESGQAATLRLERLLLAAAGASALTGPETLLRLDLRLPGLPGVWTWTGNAAGLTAATLRDRILTAGAAPYVWTGNALSLRVTRVGRFLAPLFVEAWTSDYEVSVRTGELAGGYQVAVRPTDYEAEARRI